jgi:hypothetical protein
LPICPEEPRYRVTMIAFKTDLSFEKQVFHFETYDQSFMCRECMAHKTKPSLLYTHIGPSAPWRLRPRTHSDYLLNHGHHLPAFVHIPGWSLACHRYDLMHVLHLGIGLHLLGSILVDLCAHNVWPGRSLRAQLLAAWCLNQI